MYGIELGIIILCTLSCALASSSPAISAAGLLIFWRVMMVSSPRRNLQDPDINVIRASESEATILFLL